MIKLAAGRWKLQHATAKTSVNSRRRKLSRQQKRLRAKKEAAAKTALPGSFKLTGLTLRLMGDNWRVLAGIMAVYLVLNSVFASGLSSLSLGVGDIKETLNDISGGSYGGLITALGTFIVLVSSSGSSSSQTASVLQSVLIVLVSLVVIWTLRHLVAGKKVALKQAYYRSTGQLVPFLLVIGALILRILPLALGTLLLQAVSSQGSAAGAPETVLVLLLFVGLAAWSVYMLCGAVFALYIVTLPDMEPRQALRSAKELAGFRRFKILRKFIFLPLAILFIIGAIIIPLIYLLPPLVAPVFYVLSASALLFAHAYLYNLYRSLLE